MPSLWSTSARAGSSGAWQRHSICAALAASWQQLSREHCKVSACRPGLVCVARGKTKGAGLRGAPNPGWVHLHPPTTGPRLTLEWAAPPQQAPAAPALLPREWGLLLHPENKPSLCGRGRGSSLWPGQGAPTNTPWRLAAAAGSAAAAATRRSGAGAASEACRMPLEWRPTANVDWAADKSAAAASSGSTGTIRSIRGLGKASVQMSEAVNERRVIHGWLCGLQGRQGSQKRRACTCVRACAPQAMPRLASVLQPCRVRSSLDHLFVLSCAWGTLRAQPSSTASLRHSIYHQVDDLPACNCSLRRLALMSHGGVEQGSTPQQRTCTVQRNAGATTTPHPPQCCVSVGLGRGETAGWVEGPAPIRVGGPHVTGRVGRPSRLCPCDGAVGGRGKGALGLVTCSGSQGTRRERAAARRGSSGQPGRARVGAAREGVEELGVAAVLGGR